LGVILERPRIIVDHDEREIRELFTTWFNFVDSGNTAKILDLMAEDAVFLNPGMGRMQNKSLYAEGLSAFRGYNFKSICEIHEVSVFGDLAYCWNTISTVFTPPGAAAIEGKGDTLSILKKQSGKWVVFRVANLMTGAQPQ
jgi:uncharacterized protein (TIGR02246 family)